MIEVRVEPDYAVPSRPEVDQGRRMRILSREVDVELVDTSRVRGILRPEATVRNWYNFVEC